jgi:hypothetical protein
MPRPPADPSREAAQAASEIAYVTYFNQARPHQGIQQQVPELPVPSAPLHNQREKVLAVPVLGGLHHDYPRVA